MGRRDLRAPIFGTIRAQHIAKQGTVLSQWIHRRLIAVLLFVTQC
jgi:hypothetical protein